MAGGNNDQMLNMGLMIAAGVAAPELAPLLMEGGALGATAATGVTGAALGGAAGALTGQDVAKSAAMGGLGGAAAGYFGGVNPAEQGSMLAAGPTTPGASLSAIPNIPPAGVQEAIQTGAQNVGTEAARNSIINNPAYYDSVSPLGQLPSTGSISPTQLGTMNLGADANTAYGQAYGDVYKNVLANSAPATSANALSKANMIGGGVAGINALINAPPNSAYAPSGAGYTGGSLSKFRYDPDKYQPAEVPPPPYGYRKMAEGGIASLPNSQGTVEQMSRENSLGGNQMFPQSGIGGLTGANTYQNATNTPMETNVIGPTDTMTNPYSGQMAFASGGITQLAVGGKLLRGNGDGMSDDIKANINGKQEARLADGEFVIPADVVSHLGNGSTDAGAKHLYSMMDKVRQARVGTKKQGKQINPAKYMTA